MRRLNFRVIHNHVLLFGQKYVFIMPLPLMSISPLSWVEGLGDV